jgi:uncharacterized membrane protein YdbT with pleckstrin-like domain
MNKSEKIMFEGHLHWIVFLLPIVILIVGFVLSQINMMYFVGTAFMIIGLIWGAFCFLNYVCNSIHVTESFLIIQTGILVRQTLNFSIQQLESVDVTQSLLGCLLNYGSLSVSGTGGTRGAFGPMANPLTCRRFLESMPRTANQISS